MAKFAVCRAINRQGRDKTMVKIARGETQGSFMYSLRKTWSSLHNNYDGLEEGDIELKADELGVFDIVFPLDPEKMRKAAAAEKLVEESRSLSIV